VADFGQRFGCLYSGSADRHQNYRWLVTALSIFEIQKQNLTSGAMIAITFALPPSIPTPRESYCKSKIGSVRDLNAFRALGTSVVVASTAVAIVTVGRSML
jgi:hypothetical protein